jgi:hypothetical protein
MNVSEMNVLNDHPKKGRAITEEGRSDGGTIPGSGVDGRSGLGGPHTGFDN